MTQLYKLLGLGKPTDGDFGIEIECEGEQMRAIKNKIWKSEPDGSLRGEYPESACEYVLSKPIRFEDVEPALDHLIHHNKDAEFKLSFRTSVHVHVNVQLMTIDQLLNLVYTYLLLEQPLVNYCGDNRKANRFCLRLRDAEGLLDSVNMLFSTGYDGFQYLRNDRNRYASINLEAFNKYGSIEFRAMRGTMDKAIIMPWVSMLNNIKKFAMEMENPKAIHDLFRSVGANAFMQTVLGEENTKILTHDSCERDINESYSLTIDLPYAYVAYKKQADMPKPPPLDFGMKIKMPRAPVRAMEFMPQPAPAFDVGARYDAVFEEREEDEDD